MPVIVGLCRFGKAHDKIILIFVADKGGVIGRLCLVARLIQFAQRAVGCGGAARVLQFTLCGQKLLL